MGRRRSFEREEDPSPDTESGPTCPVCGRPIPDGAPASRHHLTPKLKGGAKGETVLLHQLCHSAIHARFSEAEIARRLSDTDALRADEDMARFIAWVRNRPDGFHARTRRAGTKRGPSRGRTA